MKALILFCLFTSAYAFAQNETYRPKKMTCSEIRDALENYQMITVRYGVFDISRYTLYLSPKEARRACGPQEVAMSASFRTGDSRQCMVGFTCENTRSPGVQSRR